MSLFSSHRLSVSLALFFALGFAFSFSIGPAHAAPDSEGLASGRLYAGFRNKRLTDSQVLRPDLLRLLDRDLSAAYARLSRDCEPAACDKIEAGFVRVLSLLNSKLSPHDRIATASLDSDSRAGYGEVLLRSNRDGRETFKAVYFGYRLNAKGELEPASSRPR